MGVEGPVKTKTKEEILILTKCEGSPKVVYTVEKVEIESKIVKMKTGVSGGVTPLYT